MALVVERVSDTPIARRRVELVERKGIGHPDTICDALVEAISLALNRLYLSRTGRIAHYNIDKALLVAGRCAKSFGGGEVQQPMEFIVGDRATFVVAGTPLPITDTLEQAVDDWLRAHLPHVDPARQWRTRCALAEGSEELRSLFKPDAPVASNDTCGACGYAPLSPLEHLVLAVEHYLNSPDFKTPFGDTGQDVKVLALRRDDDVAVTVAMPFLATATASEAAYFERKHAVLDRLGARFAATPFHITWALNCLDVPGRGTEGVYLTLTGTSAEDADSGQVGRGNRANGLIAFARPTGGEATAGKNPVAHTGKIYSVLSHRMAHLIHARCPEIDEVYVHLAARIGDPVDQPWSCVQLVLPSRLDTADVEPLVREVFAHELGRIAEFQSELVRGLYDVC
jgi:S-adenosylmethionine synthetase